MGKLKLMEDEKVIKTLRPHPLAFYNLYIVWAYMFALGVVYIVKGTDIYYWFDRLPLIPADYSLMTFWALSILIPALLVALFRITWKWLALFVLVVVGIFIAQRQLDIGFTAMNALLIGASLLGIFGTEGYRRSHTYRITNFRIITGTGGLGSKKRTILYHRIDDLVVEKPMLGKIFNFGTLIPITSSGFGLGEDTALAGVGAGVKLPKGPGVGVMAGGGQSVQTPKGKSPYVLYGIPSPDDEYDVIIEAMHRTEQSQYLQRIEKLLEKKGEV